MLIGVIAERHEDAGCFGVYDGFDESSEKCNLSGGGGGDGGQNHNNTSCPKPMADRDQQQQQQQQLHQTSHPVQHPNPFGFEFVNEFIHIYENLVCEIDDERLSQAADPIAVLTDIRENIVLERKKVSDSYDLQKSLVSSIYGCVGQLITVVAAAITCMTRNALLASAQYCRQRGREVLYIDTDSIMTIGGDENLSAQMNTMFPHLEMEMKVATRAMFVQRKTYYKVEDGDLKYGQHVNGPDPWREFVRFFQHQTELEATSDIQAAFFKFFKQVYERLLAHTSLNESFLKQITRSITVHDDYTTKTLHAKFKDYMKETYPAIAGGRKHLVYYYIEDSMLKGVFRPHLDLETVDDLEYVNLFKYYENMFSTVFNLIKFHVRRNNAPYNVTLSKQWVLSLMLKGYLDAYESFFMCDALNNTRAMVSVDGENVDSSSVDLDSLFSDASYKAIFDDNSEEFV